MRLITLVLLKVGCLAALAVFAGWPVAVILGTLDAGVIAVWVWCRS